MNLEQQPWEALDVDDSDIPSLLRPCKRHHSLTIPGPAGVVHSAMHRKTLDRQNQNNTNEDNCELVSTQEYIRKAADDTSEFDDDFTHNPWISAIQFLGVGNGVIPSTHISSIKKCANFGVVDRVVAIIKSCTTNGFGGLIVTLKDPTGIVGASIHHKVLSESEFRKKLIVGSVLILEKVAVFAPTRSAQYLNITLRNLVKIFCKDDGPSSIQDTSAYTSQFAHPENHGETREKLDMVMEDTTNKKSQSTGKSKSLIQKQNLFARSSKTFVRTGHSIQGTGVAESMNEGDKFSKGSISEGTAEEIHRGDDAEMKTQPLVVKPPLPQWTDEQLEELFADDDNDGLRI